MSDMHDNAQLQTERKIAIANWEAIKLEREFDSALLRNLPNIAPEVKLALANSPKYLAEFLKGLNEPFKNTDTVSRTRRVLLNRFMKVIEVPPMPEICTDENLVKWERLNMRPVFLPKVEITDKLLLKDWVKLSKWFYQKANTSSHKNIKCLTGQWCLADFSIGVDYVAGEQLFPDDPFAKLLFILRRDKDVGKLANTPWGSRFAITNEEWRLVVMPAIAERLGLMPGQVRLERAIEFNAIGNLYDPNRGRFNICEWLCDGPSDGVKFYAGARENGGLANIGAKDAHRRFDWMAGRPLAVLS